MENEMTRAERTRALRYKRPALASMGYDMIDSELDEIREACSDVHWYIDGDNGETLLNAFDGDTDEESEFRMAFAELEAESDALYDRLLDLGEWDEDDIRRAYDDCTVALIGNRYNLVGFDTMEEDYYSLTGYDEDLAFTEAGRRLMRLTKVQMISRIGQCVGILVSFLNVRQKYDYLKATMNVLRDENTILEEQLLKVEEAHKKASDADFRPWAKETQEWERLLDTLPPEVWV